MKTFYYIEVNDPNEEMHATQCVMHFIGREDEVICVTDNRPLFFHLECLAECVAETFEDKGIVCNVCKVIAPTRKRALRFVRDVANRLLNFRMN